MSGQPFETSYLFVVDMFNRILSNRRCALPCVFSSPCMSSPFLKNVRIQKILEEKKLENEYELEAEVFV